MKPRCIIAIVYIAHAFRGHSGAIQIMHLAISIHVHGEPRFYRWVNCYRDSSGPSIHALVYHSLPVRRFSVYFVRTPTQHLLQERRMKNKK